MKKRYYITLALLVVLSASFSINQVNSQTAPSHIARPAVSVVNNSYAKVSATEVVANPSKYLYKNIKIRAKFDKFSTLGLDYPAAMRSSEKYISFLIQRPDVFDHNIPLSELKIFLKKEIAEKNIDLDAGDEVEFSGKIFSTALGDAWMDVDSFSVITKKNPPKTEENIIE